MASDKLKQLLASGEFDWDNLNHRQQFMREWVTGDPELRKTEDDADDDALSDSSLGGGLECA